MATTRTLDVRPLALLALLALLATSFVAAAELVDAPVLNNPAHSIAKHGADAAAIHNALDCAGPSSVWQSRSWRSQNKFFQTCQLDDGRWGCRIVQVGRNAMRELTSFVVKDGTRLRLVEYLSARARCVWSKE